MKCISLREPWLHAVLTLGKVIENRVWLTHYRGPVLLHRAVGMTFSEYYEAIRFIRDACGVALPTIEQFRAERQWGAIVGRCEIVGCERNEQPDGTLRAPHSQWRMRGQYGFDLINIEAFDVGVPWRGMQRFFEVPDGDFQRELESARAFARQRARKPDPISPLV